MSDELKKMLEQAQNKSRIITPGQENQPEVDPIAVLAMQLQNLSMQNAQNSRTVNIIGKASDMTQLSIQMLFNLLVEKGLISKEDLQAKYTEEVVDRYKTMEEEARKEFENQMKEQQEMAEKKINDDKKEDEVVVKQAEEVMDNVTPLKKEEENEGTDGEPVEEKQEEETE